MNTPGGNHCSCSDNDSWRHCALCRAGRQGLHTLRRAHTRSITWPQTQTSIRDTQLEDPEIPTSLDDAFSAMFQFLQISSRKCGRYHHCHRPHVSGSESETHYLRYHTQNFRSAPVRNPLTKSCDVHVTAIPGSYSVTAVRRRPNEREQVKESVHTVKLEPGKAVSLTLDL